jgi:hypothetical protein
MFLAIDEATQIDGHIMLVDFEPDYNAGACVDSNVIARYEPAPVLLISGHPSASAGYCFGR